MTTMFNKIQKAKRRLGNTFSLMSLGGGKRGKWLEPTKRTPGPGEYIAPSAFGRYVSKQSVEGRNF